MPDALELAWVLRAIVKLVCGERLAGFWRGVIDEFIAFAFRHSSWSLGFARRRAGLVPGLAAVIGALDDLAEPSAGLRSIDAVGINGRSLEVIEFPSRKMRPADFPIFPLAVRSKNECTFFRADQDSNLAHA